MACKNKKCKKACGSEPELFREDGWSIYPFNLKGLMSICKVLLILCVFVIASFQWGATGDVLWQCVWSLSLIKLVELSDE
tara:strand:- start:707 stop:946 length:240 start_codon:yes stop_codon:yes gene_type:complete